STATATSSSPRTPARRPAVSRRTECGLGHCEQPCVGWTEERRERGTSDRGDEGSRRVERLRAAERSAAVDTVGGRAWAGLGSVGAEGRATGVTGEAGAWSGCEPPNGVRPWTL